MEYGNVMCYMLYVMCYVILLCYIVMLCYRYVLCYIVMLCYVMLRHRVIKVSEVQVDWPS